jgi:hypothetical protein
LYYDDYCIGVAKAWEEAGRLGIVEELQRCSYEDGLYSVGTLSFAVGIIARRPVKNEMFSSVMPDALQ